MVYLCLTVYDDVLVSDCISWCTCDYCVSLCLTVYIMVYLCLTVYHGVLVSDSVSWCTCV